MRRWIRFPESMSGPAREAIVAWIKLDELGLNWRPDSIPLWEDTDVIRKIV